ncbi:MAG: enolase, partial [Chloroflexota bacterium]
MKLADIRVQRFRHRLRAVRDAQGRARPGAYREATASVVTIVTDDGAEGHAFGASPDVINGVVKPLIMGEHPYDREKIWKKLSEKQRGNPATLTDGVVSVVDEALWDLAGRALNIPVYRLLGGYRTKVRAYASTYVGDPDDVEGGLNSPRAYAQFALQCKARGYTAFKIHTRQPPIPGAPNPKEDVAICAAVREAVGP